MVAQEDFIGVYLKDILKRDWVLKVLSLAFGIFLWFFVVGEEKAEISISVPIELINLPSNLMVTNDIPSAVEVRVHGSRSIIKSLSLRGISKVIDLRDASAGSMTVHISPDSLPLPSGVRVLRIKPSKFEITLEPIARRSVLIKPVLHGKVAKDYEVTKVQVSPQSIIVVGPRDKIQKMQAINTIPVELNGASTSFSKETGIELNEANITLENNEPVMVTVTIRPKTGERKMKLVPVTLEGDQKKVVFSPKKVSVRLKGTIIDLKKLVLDKLKVKADISQLAPGRHKVKLRCDAPSNYKVLEIKPKTVTVRIPKQPKPLSGNSTARK